MIEWLGYDDMADEECPNSSERSGDDIDAIVLHYTAGGDYLKSSVAWFMDPEAKASAHYVVGREGQIYQLIPLTKKAWHAGGCELEGRRGVNDYSVGIEMANWGRIHDKNGKPYVQEGQTWKEYDLDVYPAPVDAKYRLKGADGHLSVGGWWEPYPEAQVEAVAKLCWMLMDALSIDSERIVGHEDICSPVGRKTDPGPLWDWEDLYRRIMKHGNLPFVMGSKSIRRVR